MNDSGGATGVQPLGRTVAVGPGDVFRKPRRPAPAGDELAEPDGRLLALAAQADQLDFDVRAPRNASRSRRPG